VTSVTRDGIPTEIRAWAAAALACMGVVFGDIGTSPLYTLNVATKAASPSGEVSPEAALGIVSLIFWAADDGRQTWPPLSCLSRNSFFANWVLRSSLQ
jgi:hypothetical protein